MADRQPIALVVDDEPDICDLLCMTLRRMNIRTDIAMSVGEAERRLQEKQYDFCLTDMRLPDGNGLQLVEKIQQRPVDRALPVAVITAHGNMDTAIAALKLGAFDFVSKPVNLERLRALVQLALKLSEENNAPAAELPALFRGTSAAIQSLRAQIEKVARTDTPVYINGETGAGKEQTARAIHSQSPRADKPFIPINCGAIAAGQLEAELFGTWDPGIQLERGLFELAEGGSLFLDDVTGLPEEIQIKLLWAIQEKCIRPAGAGKSIPVDVRVLSASHKSLPNEVTEGRFRSDLYYRINVIELNVPPLRNRAEDIPLLARSIMRKVAADAGTSTPRLTQDALTALQAYPFPGNLRQLENILERAFALCDSQTIRAADLKLNTTSLHSEIHALERPQETCVTQAIPARPDIYPQQFSSSEFGSLDEFLQAIERQAIEGALNKTRWNRTAAAEHLGISFRSLRYRLKKLNMDEE